MHVYETQANRMHTPRIRRSMGVILLGAALCLTRASAQLPPEAQPAGDAWLQKDCSVGEQDRLTPVLQAFKTQFETFFLDALNNGPPAPLLAQVEATASRIFDLRQAMLNSGKSLGLTDADLNALKMMTREQYVAREKQSFVNSYKSRAVAGLGVVAGERGKAALRMIAGDPHSPRQGLAREALTQLQAAPGKGNTKR